jgi:hypothetical protein
MSTALTIAVGLATIGLFCVTGLTYFIETRRVRPVVICHEAQKRHILDRAARSFWVASVYLTNEGTTSAFNVRFGIDMDGNHMPWKHNPDDEQASRLNVLRTKQREPEGEALHPVYIDDRVLWAIGTEPDGDVDDGRIYWAYYQGPAGDWWYTSNPHDLSADLVVKRVRSRRLGPISRGNRKLLRSIERGLEVRTQSIRDLNAAVKEQRARREKDAREATEAGEADEPSEGRTTPRRPHASADSGLGADTSLSRTASADGDRSGCCTFRTPAFRAPPGSARRGSAEMNQWVRPRSRHKARTKGGYSSDDD